MPQFQDLGRMGTIAGPSPAVWTGQVSIDRKLGSGELSCVEIKQALNDLPEFYVPTTGGRRAAIRCIDGRPLVGYFDPDRRRQLKHSALGPQIPGGSPIAALMDRVVRGGDFSTEIDLQSDVAEMAVTLSDLDYLPGGHTDDLVHPGMVGCGAIDLIPDILARLCQPPAQDQVRAITRLILGDIYDDDITDLIIGRMIKLAGKEETYFSRQPNGEYEFRTIAMDTVRKANRHGVVQLTGEHEEIAVCINYIPRTTFHRDEFCYEHGRLIQAFNYDFWRTREVAARLYGADQPSPTQHAGTRLLKYLTARAMYMTAAMMVLTDGSLHLILRTADDEPSPTDPATTSTATPTATSESR